MKATEDPNEIAEFDEIASKAMESRPFEATDRFVPEQGPLYSGLAIIRVSDPIPSKRGFGPSTAVTLVDLETGKRMTWRLKLKRREKLYRRAVPDGEHDPFSEGQENGDE